MPKLIDYPDALAAMQATGLVCNYHNSGAFGFPRGTAIHVRGLVGQDDPTIRPAARDYVHRVAPAYPTGLARLAGEFWRDQAPGDAWLMPISHWAYELEFGNAAWLPQSLQSAGVDPESLRPRNNGSPIAFAPAERAEFARLAEDLLANLAGSDFTLAFPGHPIVCTLHHHQQLWWISTRPDLIAAVDHLAAGIVLPG